MSQDGEIEELIDKLTTSGQEELDKALVKKLKTYCKNLSEKNDANSYEYITHILFQQMEKEHAQIRYGCILVIEYLFEKAHLFRKLVSSKYLSKFFHLSFGLKNFQNRRRGSGSSSRRSRFTKEKQLLPVRWAKMLRLKAAQVFKYWHDEFSNGYETLKYGMSYLERNGIDFHDPEFLAERIETRLRERNLNTLEEEFAVLEQECENLITQIDTLFELLIPRFEFDEEEEARANANNENFNFRPMRGLSFNIFLNRCVRIVRDESNCDIIDSMRDLCKQLHATQRGRLSTIGENLVNLEMDSPRLARLKAKHEQLKAQLMTIVCKANDMEIVGATNGIDSQIDGEDEDDDDDDFEDVDDDDDEGATESAFIAKMMEKEEKSPVKMDEELFRENSSSEAATSSRKEATIQASTSSSTVGRSDVVMQCRALLPSGRLCPRRDKHNCPFHGKMIVRDNEGLPVDRELRDLELLRRSEAKTNEWRDPAYLKALSERTGVDLTGASHGKRRKRYPNLIDLKKLKNTPRNRLARKFRSKKFQERIAADRAQDNQSAHEHFSAQWSHSMQN